MASRLSVYESPFYADPIIYKSVHLLLEAYFLPKSGKAPGTVSCWRGLFDSEQELCPSLVVKD
jgi:hypothetical protein